MWRKRWSKELAEITYVERGGLKWEIKLCMRRGRRGTKNPTNSPNVERRGTETKNDATDVERRGTKVKNDANDVERRGTKMKNETTDVKRRRGRKY